MVSQRTVQAGFAVMTALFGAVIARGATEFGIGWSASGPQPGTFPFYIGCLIALASGGNFILSMRGKGAGAEPFVTGEQVRRVVQFVLPIIAFVVVSLFLGLYVATAIYMFAVMKIQGRYPLWHASLVAIGLPLFLFFLLEKAFQVPLLKGPLEAALGF